MLCGQPVETTNLVLELVCGWNYSVFMWARGLQFRRKMSTLSVCIWGEGGILWCWMKREFISLDGHVCSFFKSVLSEDKSLSNSSFQAFSAICSVNSSSKWVNDVFLVIVDFFWHLNFRVIWKVLKILFYLFHFHSLFHSYWI